MAKSQPDFNITLTRPGGRRLVVKSHKDAAFKKGQTVAQVVDGKEVVFVAVGPNKPEFSFAVVDGDEAMLIDNFVTNSTTGRPHQDVGISWVGRRENETIAHKFEECTCGEGGGGKTTEGDGFTGEANFKFLATKARRSINGAQYRRTA